MTSKMPYNTRRKSLSLPALGIQLPGNGSRSSSHRSPPATASITDDDNNNNNIEPQQPPRKKMKRSHTAGSTSPTPQVTPRRTTISFADQRPPSSSRVAEQTPPPSPGEHGSFKIDTKGIDDDIVVGVIEQLEKTGNRPHLLKELAAVLSATLPIVERYASLEAHRHVKPANGRRSSANQSAIISSRLTNYLRRPWTALSPCPVGKELVGTHPKRIYFFLANQPRQAIPDPSELPTSQHRIISPSISSAADDEAERDARSRAQMSPSPEIDLSSPELEDDHSPETPGSPFSGRNSLSRDTHPPTSHNMSHNRRAQSPPLEHDEREFTQTASSLQQRSNSQTEAMIAEATTTVTEPEVVFDHEESEESAARRNQEAAAVLFGQSEHLQPVHLANHFSSSPMIKPAAFSAELSKAGGPREDVVRMLGPAAAAAAITTLEGGEVLWSWQDLTSPENVELDELDDMFDSM